MTILADPRLDVSIVPSDPTDLDRDHAARTSPFADEAHTSEPTPLELLEAWVSDDDDDQAEALEPIHPARYVVEPKHSKTLNRTIYHIVDRMEEGRFVRWAFTQAEAEGQATDLNAEDWPECSDWTRTAPPSEMLDRPIRLAPKPAAKVIDRRADELAYPSF